MEPAVNCPLCIDQSLEPIYRAGIEIDMCPTCKGVWLDRGEIEKLLESAAAPSWDVPSSPAALDGLGAAPKGAAKSGKTKSGKADKPKKKRKKSFAELLGDALEDVLD